MSDDAHPNPERMTMNTLTKVISSIALLTILAAPASARIEGDEGGLSAYPRFGAERNAAPSTFVNRPYQR